jgi:membrane protein DedA with SNARE-associated domain
MTETFFTLVSDWGAPALALATFLSCLALPVPTSLMMLAAGAFVATGDLSAGGVVGAALGGALLGDQAGYQVGRLGGTVLRARLGQKPTRARLIAGAEARMNQSGGVAVFLSRWLFSPLGPYINLIAGGTRMGWARFTLPAALGEVVWVVVYVGIGYAFGSNLAAIGDFLGNLVGLATSLALATLLGRALWRKQPVAQP